MFLNVAPTYDVAEVFERFIESFKIESFLPYLLSLVVAVLCGAAIGIERTLRQKEAGIRTHIIVALGSALVMIVSKYGFFDILNVSDSLGVDTARIAAQVVTGISFLGAGIIVHKGSVKGLTTAAGVWTTAGIGLAAGAGMYGMAVYSTIILLIVQVAIYKLLPVENICTSSVSMGLVDNVKSVSVVSDTFKNKGFEIISSSVEKENGQLICLFIVKSKKDVRPEEITKLFKGNEYVLSVKVQQ